MSHIRSDLRNTRVVDIISELHAYQRQVLAMAEHFFDNIDSGIFLIAFIE